MVSGFLASRPDLAAASRTLSPVRWRPQCWLTPPEKPETGKAAAAAAAAAAGDKMANTQSILEADSVPTDNDAATMEPAAATADAADAADAAAYAAGGSEAWWGGVGGGHGGDRGGHGDGGDGDVAHAAFLASGAGRAFAARLAAAADRDRASVSAPLARPRGLLRTRARVSVFLGGRGRRRACDSKNLRIE